MNKMKSLLAEDLIEGFDSSGYKHGGYFQFNPNIYENALPAGGSDATHIRNILLRNEQEPKELLGFKGKVVASLGTGDFPIEYYIARRGGASGFVAVEPNYAHRLYEWMVDWDKTTEKSGSIYEYAKPHADLPFSILKTDMLDFLERVPFGSISVLLCGAYPGPIVGDEKYCKKTAKEIKRVLHLEGSYIEREGIKLDLKNVSGEDILFHFRVFKKSGGIGGNRKYLFSIYHKGIHDLNQQSDYEYIFWE